LKPHYTMHVTHTSTPTMILDPHMNTESEALKNISVTISWKINN
jgi:hypothetical protein